MRLQDSNALSFHAMQKRWHVGSCIRQSIAGRCNATWCVVSRGGKPPIIYLTVSIIVSAVDGYLLG